MLELQLLVLGCGLLSASPKTFLVSTSNLATRGGMDPSNKPKTGKGKIEQKDVKEQQINNETNNHDVKLDETEEANAQNIKVEDKQANKNTTCETLQVMKDCNARSSKLIRRTRSACLLQ